MTAYVKKELNKSMENELMEYQLEINKLMNEPINELNVFDWLDRYHNILASGKTLPVDLIRKASDLARQDRIRLQQIK